MPADNSDNRPADMPANKHNAQGGSGDQEKLHELLEAFDVVALITHAMPGDGRSTASPASGASSGEVEVTSRPMQVARLDENCDLWFLTDADTAKVYEIRTDPMVHIVAQDGRDVFVSIRGEAHVHQDKATIQGLWSKPYEVWFPDGPDTPGIRALHVKAHEGQYWDSKGVNKIKYLFQSAKALVTNSTPHTEPGDQHGRVELS